MSSIRWVDREEWGAVGPRLGHVVPHGQFRGLVVHHTVIVQRDGDVCAYMRALQQARPDLGLDVPYSFVVFPGASIHDAVIAEGRSWGRTGAHTPGYNSTAYGVAFAGDFTADVPTPGMLHAVRFLGAQLADPVGALPTLGHRDVYATACPGAAAYPLLATLQPPFATNQEDDMTPAEVKQATKEALAEALGPRAALGLDGVVYITAANGGQYPWADMIQWSHLHAQNADIDVDGVVG